MNKGMISENKGRLSQFEKGTLLPMTDRKIALPTILIKFSFFQLEFVTLIL